MSGPITRGARLATRRYLGFERFERHCSVSAVSSRHNCFFSPIGDSAQRYRAHSSLSVTTNESHDGQRCDGIANGVQPKLTEVPSFPLVGSVIPQLSGIPNIDPLTKGYDFWVAMRRKYGQFYSMGSPAGGNPDCIYRTQYIINDPREMVKVVRAGGKYPSGVVEMLWVNRQWGISRGLATSAGIHGRGEEWRRIRSFFQTDLLHPEAARGYLPGIIEAAKRASRGARAASSMEGGVNLYLSRCSFDLFSSMMLGIWTETADPTTPTDPENERFVDSAVDGLSTAVSMIFSPYEQIMGKMMGFETAKRKHAYRGWDEAWAIAQRKINSFTERKKLGELTENERVSYLSRALDRQREEGCELSIKEVEELAFTGLFAAVDTTSSMLAWNLFHIARLPAIQERLHEEISSAVRSVGGGEITAEVLNKTNAPYLHALIRETHRLTPTGAIYLNKTIDADGLEIHGRPMRNGDVILLEGYTLGMDPELVEDPTDFRPERWLKDAVEARKGSPSEVIDHPFLRGPFSQGARKCPGSRIATNEIHVLLSQLVLDWKMTSPVSSLEDIEYQQLTTLEPKLPAIQFEPRQQGL